MKVSEKAADAQRKTCKSSRKPWKQNIYKCGGSRLLHSTVCISEILPPGPVPKVYSDPWPEQYVMTRAQWKKKSMSMYLRSRAAADLRGPSCARWLEFQSITLWSQQCYVSDWRLSWCITVGLTVNEKWLTLCHLWKVVLSHATDRQMAGLVDGKNPAPYLEC